MSLTLFLNQPFVSVGLQTYTFTIPAAGSVVPYGGAGVYNVKGSVFVPEALATGSGGGSGQGLGSGTGGGGEGFTGGDLGLGHGGVGQGFGAGNGYQQPPAYGSNQTSGAAVTSTVSVVVNQNGSPIYTAPAYVPGQNALEFNVGFLGAVNDVITVVLSSSTASDKVLNGVQSTIAINQGLN
jgi:hypothetical protein